MCSTGFGDIADGPVGSLAEALEVLDRVIIALVAVGGLEMAHMTRDDGWRFLSLGRHLERLLYVTTTVGEVASSGRDGDPPLLEWLLDLSDSIITYRARYMRHPEWLAVSTCCSFDRNPRSAAFQLAKLAKHVRALPDAGLRITRPRSTRAVAAGRGRRRAAAAVRATRLARGVLAESEALALALSDALTLRYFSHVYERSRQRRRL